MGTVRPFREEDIPRVVALNTKLFPGNAAVAPEVQAARFRTVCFGNPWRDPDIDSLVHEESDGTVTGFLGVVPRRMVLGGRVLRVAVGQHLMADRSPFAGFQLFRALFAGPQDLTYTDMAVDVARRIWERSGGIVSHVHSVYWRRPLRPLGLVLEHLRRRHRLRGLSAMTPVAKLVDVVATSGPRSPLHPRDTPGAHEEELTVESFLECIARLQPDRALRPVYTDESARWLFDVLGREQRFGALKKALVRGADGSVHGWYVAHIEAGGRCELLQLSSAPGKFPTVFERLLRAAWQGNALEVRGRLDPLHTPEIARPFVFFSPGRNWMLVHSRDSELLRLIHSGQVFLSRLEGDLWFF